MPWKALLDGHLADAATNAARDIAIALATSPQPTASSSDRTTFWAYASHVLDEPFANRAYDAALDDLIAELRAGATHAALYGGLAGLGWTLSHVLDGGAEDAISMIDEALVRSLSVERWPGHHDLLHGLVGLGVYFLERISQGSAPFARDGLERVVDHLAMASLETADGIAWRNAPASLSLEYLSAWPQGVFDCGVAHGVPGVIALLSRAIALTDPPGKARALCAGAVRWVTSQRRAPATHGCFPRHTYDGRRQPQTRTAWCYGDPGIAAALWFASPGLAVETALDGARRAGSTGDVREACLCHGAAGLAHLNNRLYQASGEAELGVAARTWYARALDLRGPGGIGGFAMPAGTAGDPAASRVPVANFLEGAIGIGLALLAAVTPSEPTWDRLLLCDLPPLEPGA